MLLAATPLRLDSTLMVETPVTAERGFLATSFDGLLSPSSVRKELFAVQVSPEQESVSSDQDVQSLILKAEQKLSSVRISLERALSVAETVRASSFGRNGEKKKEEVDLGEPPAPRRRVPVVAHSIDAERNLRLVADLVLTPGKTLTLSP